MKGSSDSLDGYRTRSYLHSTASHARIVELRVKGGMHPRIFCCCLRCSERDASARLRCKIQPLGNSTNSTALEEDGDEDEGEDEGEE